MKAFILPGHTNKNLVRYLHGVYIREEFSGFCQRLSVVLRSPKVTGREASKSLFMLINRTYLSNIYRYIENKDMGRFINNLNNGLFSWELLIEPREIYDFVSTTVGLSVGDVDRMEVENFVYQELYMFLCGLYNNDRNNFNILLLEVMEMMYRYIPAEQIKVAKIELTPNLNPIVLYHERTT